MSDIEKRTASLPPEHAAFIDAQVASGAFASASEVVRAGLRALQERDAAVERWLRTDIAAAHDAREADPSKAILAGRVMDRLRARAAARQKDGPRDDARRRVPGAGGRSTRHALCGDRDGLGQREGGSFTGAVAGLCRGLSLFPSGECVGTICGRLVTPATD